MSEQFQSTDDKRTDNNVMRHEYRVLTENEKLRMAAVKDLGLQFIGLCDMIEPKGSRELSLAKTKIEEAVFWAVKDITK